jgi:hypothetical protein
VKGIHALLLWGEKKYPVAIIKNENRRKYLDSLHQADKGDIHF